MRALLVEDDPSLADGIVDALAGSAIETRHVGTGREALAALADDAPDIVILDLGLPDMDGTDVARAVRQAGETPIIVISARSAELDRVLALELGADDYLVKPFGLRELLARIRAVTRRAAAAAALAEAAGAAGDGGADAAPGADSPDLGPLSIDERAQRVTLDGAPLHVTPTEFELLRYLARDPGAVRRRADILRDVWHTEWFGATKTLDAHVAALRRKLGSPEWIQSVRGVGFRFEIPAAVSAASAAGSARDGDGGGDSDGSGPAA
ncbi:response regulator transcription factor [Schumannella luteola]|uniref:DNA-binding response OmpR family regulator n=1 Tax=Schumannella luteola TaxID=472059 RepID=A0A852YSR8_9MICO|nr:response regulator transcription factor [Schumannella luteola]NYH00740.1 DNA-binding response OmpR family regulator [Schumannella luteola]TPX03952.1 response regulator transcription factor [Schumannella luteola]